MAAGAMAEDLLDVEEAPTDEVDDNDSSKPMESVVSTTSCCSKTVEDYEYDGGDDDEDPLKDFRPLSSRFAYHASFSHDNNNNERHQDVDQDDDIKRSKSAGVEVMPRQDMTKVRVQLKETFMGIPMPASPFSSFRRKKSTSKKKIDRNHECYRIAVGMMMGIREAVGGLDVLQREASFEEGDFHSHKLFQECRHNRKYVLSTENNDVGDFAEGSNNNNNNNHSDVNSMFGFKAYAPLVFSRIRAIEGLDKNLFLHSVCGLQSYREFLSNAKSGSFFFFSGDGKYLIKTLTATETKFLVDILPHYYHFLVNNPKSFLTRFYGLYRIQMPTASSSESRPMSPSSDYSGGGGGGSANNNKGSASFGGDHSTTTTTQTIYFSIMRSVFTTSNPMSVTYDLKGSTLGRSAKPGEGVQKDLDILAANRKLHVPSRDAVLQQLRRDATMLARLGILDYSFLVGIHERPPATTTTTLDGTDRTNGNDDINNKGTVAEAAAKDVENKESSDQHQHCVGDDDDDDDDDDDLTQPHVATVSAHEDQYKDWTPPRSGSRPFESRSNRVVSGSAQALSGNALVSGMALMDDSEEESNGIDAYDQQRQQQDAAAADQLHEDQYMEEQWGCGVVGGSVNDDVCGVVASCLFPDLKVSHQEDEDTQLLLHHVNDDACGAVAQCIFPDIELYTSSKKKDTEGKRRPLWDVDDSEEALQANFFRDDGGIDSLDGQQIYYAGIIDILQPYNTRKWGETHYRTTIQGNSKHEISCVDPETYANRFIKFLTNLMTVTDTTASTESNTL